MIFKIKPTQKIPWWAGFINVNEQKRVMYASFVPLSFVLRSLYLLYGWISYPFRDNLVEIRQRLLNERVRSLDALEKSIDERQTKLRQ